MFITTGWNALTGKTAEDQKQLTPEQESIKKKADYNEKLWGSRTVEKRWNEYGQGEWFSNLTGNTYTSAEAARADEAAMVANPSTWASNRAMTGALGEQSPVETGTQVADMGIDVGETYQAGRDALDREIANPFAPPPPPPPNLRGGFTDELIRTPQITRRQGAAPNPAIPAIFSELDPGTAPLPANAAEAPHGGPQTGPGAEAPDVNREAIDRVLGGLEGYQHDLYAMGQDNTGLSVAQAQLEKSYELAKIRARDELATNQAGALGMARSSRSRADRGLLERQAIGEQAYLGSQKQRNDVLQQAEYEGNQAILRATEEDADRKFRLEAIDRASRLGLNVAALETDIAKADLDSATNWVNQEFAQWGLDKQLNQDEAKQLLGFTRDMAAMQFEYDKLSTDDQNVADQLMMQKYGIDQTILMKMKELKEAGKFKWDDFLAKLVGGAVGGLTGGVAGAIGGAGSGGDEGTSPSDW